MNNPLNSLGEKAQAASIVLAQASTVQKDEALTAIAEGLEEAEEAVLSANAADVEAARRAGMPDPQIDRLRLTATRLNAMRAGLLAVRDLVDPVGRLLEEVRRPNGLKIEKRAVPIGVIGIVFESRPNVALDAAALCLKSGNACLLRGGSDSWQSVEVLVSIVQSGLQKVGLPRDTVQNLPSSDRRLVGALLTLDRYVDLIIPRGGKSLIARVREESRVPVLSHLDGICHTYVDAAADPKKALEIVLNAKMRRTSICGATECLLLHKDIVSTIGKDLLQALLKSGCELRVPPDLLRLNSAFRTATPEDYGHEFLAPILAVAVVANCEEAVEFINRFGSQHTDAIITENVIAADYFLAHTNSAIAIHNASTQFADGGEFGKGAEIGIATGKLHARGPVGLQELTTYKYYVYGNGQIRP